MEAQQTIRDPLAGLLAEEIEAELKPLLADFALHFIRTLLQTSYYNEAHPVHREGVRETFRLLERVQRFASEISFVASSLHDAEDIFIQGVLAEPISLQQLLRSAMGEHFTKRFLEYFHRNDIVSFAIRRDLDEREFDRFMMLVVEHRLDVSEEGGERPPFDEVLTAHDVFHITVMCRQELIGTTRRIPWAVNVALSRLRKDLRLVPLYCNATKRELEAVKAMIVADIVRPLQRVDLVRDLVLNADLVAAEVSDVVDIDIEAEVIHCLHPQIAAKVGLLLVRELDQFPVDAESETEWAVGVGSLRRDRVLFALRRVGDRFLERTGEDDEGLLYEMFRRKLIPLERLPSSIRTQVLVRGWTDQYLDAPHVHLQRLGAIPVRQSYVELLDALGAIAGELARRGEVYELSQLIGEVAAHASDEASSPFPQRATLARGMLQRLASKEVLGPVVQAAQHEDRDKRMLALQTIQAFGRPGVPFLLQVLYEASEPAVARDAVRALEELGDEAGPDVLLEIETFRHKAPMTRTLLYLLGRLGYADAAGTVARYLAHYDAAVRREAARVLVRLDPQRARKALLLHLDEQDDTVLAAILDGLRQLRCADVRVRRVVWGVLEDPDLGSRAPALLAAVLRLVRTWGNIACPDAPDQRVEGLLVEQVSRRRTRAWFAKKHTELPPAYRAAIYDALCSVATEKSIEVLEQAKEHEAPEVAPHVEAALRALRARLVL